VGRDETPDAAGCGDPTGSDAGAATVVAVSLAAVLLLIGMSAVFVTATATAHRRAQGAADLAALAGAATLQQAGDHCAAAAEVAAANDAALVSCSVRGQDVVLTVEVDGPDFLGHGFTPTGQARAGPG
jgi:secretion/DNA translocation related TadE-like protein